MLVIRDRLRMRLRVMLAVAVGTATVSAFAPAVGQESNPARSILIQAQGSEEVSVSSLVGSIAEAQAELDRLELEVGELSESVNKSLVDLHDAQASAEQARQGVIVARSELNQTQREIEEAQATLDELSRVAYRRTTTPNAVTTLAGDEASADSLDRQTYLRTQAETQSEAIERLDLLRTEQANKESQLRQARDLAEQREVKAQSREADARAAIDKNSELMAAHSLERDRLIEARDGAQQQLDTARNDAATTNSQQQDQGERRQAETTRKQAEEQATAAIAAKEEAEKEAASATEAAAKARDEAEVATKIEEAAEEEAAAESETEVGVPERDAAGAQDEADQDKTAAEVEAAAEHATRAEEHARAQIEEQERAEAAVTERAREAEDAQIFRDAATAAAVAAAAAVIADSQPNHAELESPYPPVSDEDTEPAEIAAVQNPAVDNEAEVETEVEVEEPAEEQVEPPAEVTTIPDVTTIDDVTEEASGEISGDQAATIESVIARAESQIGVPYAWGGGNANGPTQGIRDGGIGDANGDFNKVGFDCSGFTLYAFAGAGIALPHFTGYQYNHGTKVDPGQMQRGDLIFYGPSGNQHVAIYLGDGMMIEAPSSGSTVSKSPVRWSGMSEYAVRLI